MIKAENHSLTEIHGQKYRKIGFYVFVVIVIFSLWQKSRKKLFPHVPAVLAQSREKMGVQLIHLV